MGIFHRFWYTLFIILEVLDDNQESSDAIYTRRSRMYQPKDGDKKYEDIYNFLHGENSSFKDTKYLTNKEITYHRSYQLRRQ